jgi:F0F1-type ATP synthase assembly protein I
MKEKPTVGSPVFRGIHSGRIPEAMKVLMYILLFIVAIPVSYTSEFWELFEATT